MGLTPADNRPRRLRPRRCRRPLRHGGCGLAPIRQGHGHACRGDEGGDRPAALLQPGSGPTLYGRVARRTHTAHPRHPGVRCHEIVRTPSGATHRDAHATHTPRTRYATHTPCTHHAHATHAPCMCTCRAGGSPGGAPPRHTSQRLSDGGCDTPLQRKAYLVTLRLRIASSLGQLGRAPPPLPPPPRHGARSRRRHRHPLWPRLWLASGAPRAARGRVCVGRRGGCHHRLRPLAPLAHGRHWRRCRVPGTILRRRTASPRLSRAPRSAPHRPAPRRFCLQHEWLQWIQRP